jgi:hypothetical protein
VPKSQQSKANRALHEIWMAETKKDALAAFDAFVETWGVSKAVASSASRSLLKHAASTIRSHKRDWQHSG